MKAKIVLLPGDGIGPEIVGSAETLLLKVAELFGHEFEMTPFPIGGNAIDDYGNPLPDMTVEACLAADAILLGAVGGPKWDDPKAQVRPEQGLLGIRKKLDLYANLRPITPHKDLMGASPLRSEVIENVDFVVIRELTGGIYFGEPRERRNEGGVESAVDTMIYTRPEIERVAHLAFRLAQQRSKKLTSVDKANVLECSRLWRETVSEVAEDYPDVVYGNLLVDAAAMFLITKPSMFDVILTGNMFGDILTDESSVLTGSLGNLPSASIGSKINSLGKPLGLYEPIHGSAPDIAGKGIANPGGTILSAAMLLRHSLGLEEEAKAVEAAVSTTLNQGYRTADIAEQGVKPLTTSAYLEKIISNLTV
ncbi:MAG: 3-isopropylmalate dehydrogenase [Anaerolineales bacterium]|nr:3-isopropylmalate dehydrogenase [Anaerolineales bacterium]